LIRVKRIKLGAAWVIVLALLWTTLHPWTEHTPTPSSAQEAAPGARSLPRPSQTPPARSWVSVVPPAPTTTPVPSSPSPTVQVRGPGPTRQPRTTHSLRGSSTWFRSPAGVSAAGPTLRDALGPGWRGQRVRVCYEGRCVVTVLGDWCACPGGRVIDLAAPLFARLAPLSRGVLKVKVSW